MAYSYDYSKSGGVLEPMWQPPKVEDSTAARCTTLQCFPLLRNLGYLADILARFEVGLDLCLVLALAIEDIGKSPDLLLLLLLIGTRGIDYRKQSRCRSSFLAGVFVGLRTPGAIGVRTVLGDDLGSFDRLDLLRGNRRAILGSCPSLLKFCRRGKAGWRARYCIADLPLRLVTVFDLLITAEPFRPSESFDFFLRSSAAMVNRFVEDCTFNITNRSVLCG